MKKVKIVALVLAFALMLSGCSLFRVDEELVKAQTVAWVNGTAITRQQVEIATQSSQSFLYEMYYYGFEEEDLKEDEDTKKWYLEYLNSSLDMLVENELLRQKAPELGISLSEEEKQEKREEVNAEFELIKEQIRSEVETELGVADTGEDTGAEGEQPAESPAPTQSAEAESPAPAVDEAAIEAEVEKRYQEYITESDFSPDKYYDMLCGQLLTEKVAEYVKGLAAVSDEEVKKWYDDTIALQQKEMDEDPTVFASNMNSNLICTYVPEDTIAVKQVLIKFKDQDVAEVAKQLYSTDKAQAMKLLEAQIEVLNPQMLEIKTKLEAGEDIDKLIKDFGEDEGMTTGAAATIGYLVGESTTTYLEEFKNAAMALKEGQVSAPVATYYGLHVLKNIKTYKKGVIPFDGLKDSIKTALLPGNQQKKYEETIEQWKSEADIKYDRARLEN